MAHAAAASIRNPVPGLAEYPKNNWYVVALASEVSKEKPLGRFICDTPIVLYRDVEGQAVALFDQCPHRGLPLSAGSITDNGLIRCGYHGFEFGSDGVCKHLTTPDRIPPMMRARTFPLVERGAYIWLWPGEGEPDLSLVPDHDHLRLTAPGWRVPLAFSSEWPGNYMLQVENTSDNLHLDYLHGSLKVDDGLLGKTAPKVEQIGTVVRGTTVLERTPSTLFDVWMGFDIDEATARTREIITEMHAPHISRLEWSVWDPSDPDAVKQTYAINTAITPATHNTHWVFNATAINFNGREQTNEDIDFLMTQVFEQDRACFAAVQGMIDRVGVANTDVSVGMDERVLRVRRIIGQMLAAEREMVPA